MSEQFGPLSADILLGTELIYDLQAIQEAAGNLDRALISRDPVAVNRALKALRRHVDMALRDTPAWDRALNMAAYERSASAAWDPRKKRSA
jgi:hypothetical protein